MVAVTFIQFPVQRCRIWFFFSVESWTFCNRTFVKENYKKNTHTKINDTNVKRCEIRKIGARLTPTGWMQLIFFVFVAVVVHKMMAARKFVTNTQWILKSNFVVHCCCYWVTLCTAFIIIHIVTICLLSFFRLLFFFLCVFTWHTEQIDSHTQNDDGRNTCKRNTICTALFLWCCRCYFGLNYFFSSRKIDYIISVLLF